MRRFGLSQRLSRLAATVLLVAASIGLFGGSSAASEGPAARVTLSGHVPVQVRSGHATRLGASDPTQSVTLGLVAPLQNKSALDQLIQAVSTPGSSSYGKYLRPSEFASRFGATDDQRSAIERFIAESGFQEQKVYNNGLYILATTTVAQASRAFGITFANYRESDGVVFRSPTADPSIPGYLQGTLVHVSGLDTLPSERSRSASILSTASVGYTPAQLWTAYNEAPLLASGFSGTGETVANVQFGTYDIADIQQFESLFAPSSATVASTPLGGGCGPAIGSPNLESDLDIEMQIAFAPGVKNVLVYNTQDQASCGGALYQQIATDDVATSISSSWTICEPDEPGGLGYDPGINAALYQMAAQGQTFFAASGDDGAYGCYEDLGSPNQFAVSVTYPASDPNAVAVGGTNLTLNGTNGWSGETGWNYSVCTTTCSSSGGGFSWVFPRPAWQVGLGPSGNANKNRAVPDVALDGDPNSGYWFVFSGTPSIGGGTSFGAPAWSGIAAVYNQYAVAQGHPRLGYANPAFYTVANTGAYAGSFHDVTNGFDGVYEAASGYDLITGWGTPNVASLIPAMIAATAANDTPSATCPATTADRSKGVARSGTTVIVLPVVLNGQPAACLPVTPSRSSG